jgi:hypothetical protein
MKRIALLGLVLLAGCAGMGSVEDAPPDKGVSNTYHAPYEATTAAALETMKALNLTVKDQLDTEGNTAITFVKSMSAFSWGEVGRVMVKRLDAGSTQVTVLASKRYKVQVTGSTQNDFARQIFAGISERLPK